MSYYYIFERLTHDGKAMKMIRLSLPGELHWERKLLEYALKKESDLGSLQDNYVL